MEAKNVVAYCARERHNNKAVPAEFVVWEAQSVPTVEGNVMRPVMMGKAFACCAAHIDEALAHVLTEVGSVAIIRKESVA